MALKLKITTSAGAVFDPAWCRVESVTVTQSRMTFSLRKYGLQVGAPFFDEEGFEASYEVSGENPFTQAYAYLRTLPQFSGAEDVDDAAIDPAGAGIGETAAVS
ncbi:hypothetical protein [Paraburkholderia adhaesiva]|uniref:hypothetical protein n=1 Tax=Paraburkholderia adhaesiva TaxID=2883244 RepID=UPI001F406812|nr:hypothetical protein [Paraburkholderia adhaesiva]